MTDDGRPMDPLLDAAPCGFVSFTDDGTILVANATLLELLGYARGEVVGQPRRDDPHGRRADLLPDALLPAACGCTGARRRSSCCCARSDGGDVGALRERRAA